MPLAYFIPRAADMPRDEASVRFYDAFPSVRRLYRDIAAWTGLSEERIVVGNLQEERGARNSMLAIRSIAGQIAVHDVLAAEGVSPQLVVALSMGINSASAMIGALSRQELFAMLWHQRDMPEPEGQAEGVAYCHLGADSDLDRFCGKDRDGVYLAVDFGAPPDGPGRNLVLSGYRSALERLAADERHVIMTAWTTAIHSPLRKPASDFIREYVTKLAFRDPVIPLAGCMDNRLLTTADEVREAIWRNLTRTASVPVGLAQAIQAGVQMFLLPGPSMAAGMIDFPVPVLAVREPADIETAVTAVNRLVSGAGY